MDFDTSVKSAVYRHFADTGEAPRPKEVAAAIRSEESEILNSYARLQGLRVLVLGDDESSIRMAPPFSGVPTQHVVESGGVLYHANCAWDALGIPAALGHDAIVTSRCEQSGEPLRVSVTRGELEPCDWVFHCQVPATHWWDDIGFT